MAPHHGPHFPADKQLTLDDVAGNLLSPAELAMLKGLVQELQAQREDGEHAENATFLDLMAQACTAFRVLPVPGTVKWLLGRALGHYKGPYNSQTLLTKTFQVLQTQGVEGMAQVLELLGVNVVDSRCQSA